MDLYHHSKPPFTNWVLAEGLLHENFVVIDIGCQGGEHPRWSLLGDKIDFYGFDPIREGVEALRSEGRPRRTYFEVALGDTDGEREFFVSNNTFSSSFFGAGGEALNGYPEIERGRRVVPVRRLDSLFGDGVVPPADYLKLDCEGFEPYVLRGARKYLNASAPICVSTETGFNSTLCALRAILARHELRIFDVNVVRSPRPAYATALREQPWPEPDPLSEAPHLHVGSPGTLDVVFCRDLVSGTAAGLPNVDRLIKTMINFELHGLMDCAYEIVINFRETLQQRFDVDKATKLLLMRPPHARNTADVVNCLKMVATLRADALANRNLISDVTVQGEQQVQRAEPDADVSEKNLLIERCQIRLLELDTLLSQCQSRWADAERLLAEKNEALCTQRVHLVELERLLTASNLSLSETEARLTQTEGALQAWYSSRSWRLTASMRRALTWLRRR